MRWGIVTACMCVCIPSRTVTICLRSTMLTCLSAFRIFISRTAVTGKPSRSRSLSSLIFFSASASPVTLCLARYTMP